MKIIAYTRPDGGLSLISPVEGARLAVAITLADGTQLAAREPRPVDSFLRRWPVEGAKVQWAETEDEFIARIRQKDVPADALSVVTLEAAALPERAYRDAWEIANGAVVVNAPKQQAIVRAQLAAVVQGHLDAKARERGYDSIFSACTYADEPAVSQFQAEGQAFRAWRSQVWAYCYAQLDAVQAGKRAAPTVEALIAELPALDL